MQGGARRHFGSGNNHSLPPWIRGEWAARNGLADRQSPGMPEPRFESFAQRQRGARYFHASSYVNGENVMAFAAYHHVEARHPFHDRRLTEFVMGLPGHVLLESGVSKRLLRQAMKGTLPEEVRIRKDKAGFAGPIVSALDSFFAETPIERLSAVREGWLDAGELSGQLQRYRACRGEGSLMAVWLAVSLDVWMKHGVS
jgi:asparagine synthase (glutamine-hydrolysing)